MAYHLAKGKEVARLGKLSSRSEVALAASLDGGAVATFDRQTALVWSATAVANAKGETPQASAAAAKARISPK